MAFPFLALHARHALERMDVLVDLAISSVVRKVHLPGGKLENLKSHSSQATYLCQLNVALAARTVVADLATHRSRGAGGETVSPPQLALRRSRRVGEARPALFCRVVQAWLIAPAAVRIIRL